MWNVLFFVFLHMTKPRALFLFLLFVFSTVAQEVTLPEDFRQHNITEYNSSLFNPAFSLIRNNPESVALWTRWQWQQIDADPTTLFLNYTRRLNPESAISGGFFQHNTGFFVNTGGVVNYAYAYEFSPNVRFGAGVNLFGFVQELADDRFFIDPNSPFPTGDVSSDFILQMAPGVFLQWKSLVVGFASENLFDYNFSTRERNTGPDERIYLTSVSYDFKIGASDSNILRPTFYYKSVPRQDGQIGIGALYTTDKYWGQAGYNNFYGISVGAGGRFFKKVSIGALVEFATDSDLDGRDTTFEVALAYHIKSQFEKRPELKKEEAIVENRQDEKIKTEAEIQEEKKLDAERQKRIEEEQAQALAQAEAEKQRQQQLEAERKEKQQEEDDLKKRQEEEAVRKQQVQDSLKTLALEKERRAKVAEQAQKRQDSLEKVKAEKLLAVARQRKRDSIQQAKEETARQLAEERAQAEATKKEEVTLNKNEKYEEVISEGELLPGFYLITNVFGTKKYYDAFMKDLKSRGLEPKSFLRSLNNYNYVYLKRYDTMLEARKARDSKFDGRYTDKTWIFRVVGE